MRNLSCVIAGLLLAITQLAVVGFGFAGTALAATCMPAGASGLTAVVVATTGQNVSGSIDATGCDLGVYVGPGVTGVTIVNATISGANDEGILVQDTSQVTILHNTVTGNAVKGETFPETKAIQAIGSDHVVIAGNTVTGNGGGGIGIADDGALNPSGPLAGKALAGSNNWVGYNIVTDSAAGCGIVISAYNPGAGANDNVVQGNVVERNPAGIIVAADTPNTTANGNQVLGNTSTDNAYSGVILHSNAPGDVVTFTQVTGNVISGNGGGGHQPPVGVVVAAGAPTATLGWTTVGHNQIAGEGTGIGLFGDTHTDVHQNWISNVSVTTPVGVAH